VRDDINQDQLISDVEAQVRSLERMNLAALRDFWRARWGAAPTLRAVELLRLIIAWRIQAAAEGGLGAEVRGEASRQVHAANSEPAGWHPAHPGILGRAAHCSHW